jgi:hypothetical protein
MHKPPTRFAAPLGAILDSAIPGRGPLIALLLSCALAIANFALQGHYGFNLGDEGFLWYGVQRVQVGEVPIRDFLAYDPGRYYWSAAIMDLIHAHGIIGLRIAGNVFELIGLAVALLLFQRPNSIGDFVWLTAVGATLLAWMFNWYKDYDTSLSIILIGVLTLLIQEPSNRRFFFAGIVVGLAAIFGRNHGVYGVAGVLGVVFYLTCRHRSFRGLMPRLACCACGVIVGYLPVLIMLIAVPGFATANWELVRIMFDRGSTGLPLPVPWPWLVTFRGQPPMAAAAETLTGVLYVAILVFGILSPVFVIRQALLKRPVAPATVAVSMLALPYAHYAFSRAELFHLSLGIFPLLIGLFIFLQRSPGIVRPIGTVAMLTITFLIVLPQHPGWDCRVIEPCVPEEIGGDRLQIQPIMKAYVSSLKVTVSEYAPNGQSFLVTPMWPAAYALFNRKSPMWDEHALFPQSPEFQQKEIERIKKSHPGFVLIVDQAVDGRDDLRFRNSHSIIYQFVNENFDVVETNLWYPVVFRLLKPRT